MHKLLVIKCSENGVKSVNRPDRHSSLMLFVVKGYMPQTGFEPRAKCPASLCDRRARVAATILTELAALVNVRRSHTAI